MAHLDRLETRWVQRIEALMPASGTAWIALLALEHCRPERPEDAQKLADIARGDVTDRKVNFVRYGLEHGQPDFDLWKEYGCKVTFFSEPDETSVDLDRKAHHWALTADDGDIVRMAQFFPHIEDTSYEAHQSSAARDEMERRMRPIRTSHGVITATELDRLHQISKLYGGQMASERDSAEKKRFDAGMKTLIGELLQARVFVVHDDRPRDADGFPINAWSAS